MSVKDELRKEWYKENNTDTTCMSPRDVGYHVGYKAGLMKAINILSERERNKKNEIV